MGLLSEFKAFAMRGNVVDMAVGIVIGGAFGQIISALVDKILMPLTGALTGGVDFSQRSSKLTVPGLEELNLPAPEIGWGAFVQASINFIIVAFALFMVIKVMNSLKKAEEAAPPAAPPEDVLLLREIRDALKKS
ncbi:large-conductance mechanosensitive channel protein MscL [Botrimarina hoheduenensis]|uniref:Large-conductance mechanosensitive channel n=1 Tax=Botrimarina hoheduenensis TaxID=2528000 RepID=A0A5C5WEU2_9BACT|nr:large-conductance mechanosensitive channel protein MscL [Botrimarina hoheduenensis]TWT48623.1 Large-conductance mechanosensitive channel [Botrimarina hoheduenensis]